MSKQQRQKHYNKLPFTYTFRRCEHNHTHTEQLAGCVYTVCDACSTIRRNSLTEALKRKAANDNMETEQQEAA